MFSDLTWHRDPKQILDRVREIAKPDWNTVPPESTWKEFETSHPLPFRIQVGRTFTKGTEVEGAKTVAYHLPVDHHLETNAKQWIKSKEQNKRLTATRAMMYFRNAENAQLLKSVLQDEGEWDHTFTLKWTAGQHFKTAPRHLVRFEAWHVLTAWGIDCHKPDFQ